MKALLLTASVKCNDPNTIFSNSSLRRKSYIETFAKWMKQGNIENFVVCENSGDIKLGNALKQIAHDNNRRLEYLRYLGSSDMVFAKGKGFGEGEAIKYAVENSQIISECEEGFYKVTGKLFIRNFRDINNSLKPGANCFHLMSTCLRKNKQVDTRFFCSTQDFYKENLLEAYKDVDDRSGIFLEHIFYKILKDAHPVKKFPVCPEIEGFSSTSGGKYHSVPMRKRLFYSFGLYNVK